MRLGGCLDSRRPSVAEVVDTACGMTRWRMTKEANEVLDFARRQRHKAAVTKKVRLAGKDDAEALQAQREAGGSSPPPRVAQAVASPRFQPAAEEREEGEAAGIGASIHAEAAISPGGNI